MGEPVSVQSAPEVVTFIPTWEQFAWTFGRVEPRLRVKPGQVIQLWTEDAFGGRVFGPETPPSKAVQYPFVNPQTGPFYVEGAEPGDTLAIHLIDVQPARDFGISSTIPFFGGLTSTRFTATLQDPLPERVWVYKVDRARGVVVFQAIDSDFSMDLPLTPFHGTIGVAPAAGEARNTLVPEAFGGNMDTPEARAGTTLYLGVNEPGALFSIGDGHYSQSEGEVCGSAVEGAMNTALVVEVIKGVFCEWPRLEDDEYIMTAGSIRPLEDAFRIAHTQLVRWLAADTGLSIMDAYQLVSQVARTPIANVVDTNYTVIAKFPKRFLPRDLRVMSDAHARLRAVGQLHLANR